MKVIILGAGVMGVCTAYLLVKQGFEVTVIDRHGEAAMESSYANGCQLSYSHCEPWATAGNLWKGIKWLGHKEAPLLFRLRWDWEMYRWLAHFIINALPAKVARNTLNILKLSFYSRNIMHELLDELDFDFDFQKSGILHLFHNKETLEKAEKHFKFESRNSDELTFKVLSAKQCLNLEPAASHLIKEKYGGIYFPKDETGDIFKFTRGLAAMCTKLGVNFLYNTDINTLTISGNRISGVNTNQGFYTANKFIVALGAYTGKYLRMIGINLPIYPMKGYSISIPTQKQHDHLSMSITDQKSKIVYTPVKGFLRAAGTVEFAGFNHEILPERITPILHAIRKFFPNGGDFDQVVPWACLRPQTPQSSPIIGRTRYNNLYINSGHGSLGWTQALGSSKIVADIVADNSPEISLTGLKL